MFGSYEGTSGMCMMLPECGFFPYNIANQMSRNNPWDLLIDLRHCWRVVRRKKIILERVFVLWGGISSALA